MTSTKDILHPRNIFRKLYDFTRLCKDSPNLTRFVTTSPRGTLSINFADPLAVKALNAALLKTYFQLEWDIPYGFLCPPIPGRLDYIHYVADILAKQNNGLIPQGDKVTVLDIGTGANCIFPLLGHKVYGWHFIGSDINPKALQSAAKNIQKNHLESHIQLKMPSDPSSIFKGVLSLSDPIIDITMCNPPFHSSKNEAEQAALRKQKNLKLKTKKLNFGGQNQELFCDGGEVAFIKQMISESVHVPSKCFTTLVSKSANLPEIYKELKRVFAINIETIEMGQGQKKSRIISWSFKK